MTSQEIYPSLIFLNADGSELARNDDISPSNFNSTIVATLTKDGIYIVLARSSNAKQSGAYSLRAFIVSAYIAPRPSKVNSANGFLLAAVGWVVQNRNC